eukprot:TRINITY_DN42277_c0_g1_i1.p1 TRINITY_DN42277_c0_g1~~TRINITY_DN42277_c0_g1_i1.p1  ORF type:complete len:1155 (-),score=250.59 TRINITY_DN42277_c0_g1_i1:50-3514(-)
MSPPDGARRSSARSSPGVTAGGYELRATGPWNDQWKAVDANLQEPETLEIEYVTQAPPDPEVTTEEGGEAEIKLVKAKEIVYEDPGEKDSRPRLLVPLKSVLGLKQLCEHEFARIEQVTSTLNQCRTAYYKELLYLREQLILAADPEKAMVLAFMQDYEVYYYDPPKYVDEELKEFMLNCNRWTHKKLIEENYELRQRLAGMDDVFANVDFCIKQLLKKLGPHRFMIMLHKIVKSGKDIQQAPGTVATKVQEGEDQPPVLTPMQDLEVAVLECFPSLKPKADTSDAWREKVEELEKMIQDLKRQLRDSQEELDFQRKRAEDALARARELDQKLSNHPTPAKPGTPDDSALRELEKTMKDQEEKLKQYQQQGEGAARRVRKAYEELAKAKSVQTGTEPPALAGILIPSLDSAVSGMENILRAVANMKPEKEIVTGPAPTSPLASNDLALRKEINQLKQEINALKAKLAAAEENEEQLRAQLKGLEDKLTAAEARLAKMKNNPTETVVETDNSEVDNLRARLAKKDEKIAELEQELEAARAEAKVANKRAEDSERLLQDKLRQDADRAKQMAELMAKLKASEDESENLGAKLYRAQEKIQKLKEEIKILKRKLGIEVRDSDDESSDEEDLPAFMTRYYVRARNSAKPRWMLLSEDAKLHMQKKDWLWGQKYPSTGGLSHAQQALRFLRAAPSAAAQHNSKYRGPTHVDIEGPWHLDPGSFQGWQGLGIQNMPGPPHAGQQYQQGAQRGQRSRSPSPSRAAAPIGPTPLAPARSPVVTQKVKLATQAPQNLQQIFEASGGARGPSHVDIEYGGHSLNPARSEPVRLQQLYAGRVQTKSQVLQPQQQVLQPPVVRNLFPESQAEDRRAGVVESRPARQLANLSVPSSPAGAQPVGGNIRSPPSGDRGKSRSPSPGVDRTQHSSSGAALMVDSRREREDSQFSPTSVLSTSISFNSSIGQSSWRSKDPPKSDGGSTRASEHPTPAVSRGTPKAPMPPVANNRVSPPSVLRDEFANTPGVNALRSPGQLQARQRGSPVGTGIAPAQTSPNFRSIEFVDAEAAVERSRRHLGDAGSAGMQSPSAAVLSWAGSGLAGARSQSSFPLTNAPKSLLAKNRGLSHSISNPGIKGPVELVSSDTLPRLPGGKIRKEPAAPSWLVPS